MARKAMKKMSQLRARKKGREGMWRGGRTNNIWWFMLKGTRETGETRSESLAPRREGGGDGVIPNVGQDYNGLTVGRAL